MRNRSTRGTWMSGLLAATCVALLAASRTSAAAGPADPCGRLRGVHLQHGSISTAENVAAGDLPLRGAPEKKLATPAHCRIAGILRPGPHSEVAFEVWLPQDWNGRYEASGNGGFAGRLNRDGLAGAIARGSVGSSTDTGHVDDGRPNSEPMRWAYDDDRVADYGHRAIHATAVAAKSLIRAYYGRAPRHSYFASCSNGGRQGLMEAQRYPADYDGIIAGAPAYAFTRLLTGAALSQQRLELQPAARLQAAQISLVRRATLAACDARDGVADGVVNDPRRCAFDPASLACASGAPAGDCLGAAQVQTLNLLYGRTDPSTAHFEPGTETDTWLDWISGRGDEPAWQVYFALRMYRDMLHRDSQWTLRDFDARRDPAQLSRRLGPLLDATDADLSAFAARGGKLILYHGWADAAIPAGESIRYYEALGRQMGEARRDAFARLYLVPGMTHCIGGDGYVEFGQFDHAPAGDGVRARITDWVERRHAPQTLLAHRGGGAGSRPLCAHPMLARWNGTASTEEAASFDCAAP
jgi:feruloyl esterase